jgi:hypothetical protein
MYIYGYKSYAFRSSKYTGPVCHISKNSECELREPCNHGNPQSKYSSANCLLFFV